MGTGQISHFLNLQNLDPHISIRPTLLPRRLFIILVFMILYFSAILSYLNKLPLTKLSQKQSLLSQLNQDEEITNIWSCESMCVRVFVYNNAK